MNKQFFKAVALSVTLLLAPISHVDAKRFGGGKSFGKMPSAPMQKKAAPVQKPTQPAQATPAGTPASPQAAKPGRFGGMLGGLAAGLGIGYLLSHLGLGEGAASFVTGLLMAVLVGFVLLFIIRRFMPAASGVGQNSPLSNQAMQRTNLDANSRQEPAFNPTTNAFSGTGVESPEFESTVPAGFDERAFLDNAEQYFVSLQKSWDQGDLVSLREFTTPDMFSEIQQDLAGRGELSNHTDVVTIQSKLIGIETIEKTYYCSVQFSGMIREQEGAQANNFSEIWNLSKPVEGPGGWVLAGIQQLV
uniref:Tim44 domain-containing protein n=1 Tax=Polynucleobacter sp. TaxID=2029855 RepID=UPI0040481868